MIDRLCDARTRNTHEKKRDGRCVTYKPGPVHAIDPGLSILYLAEHVLCGVKWIKIVAVEADETCSVAAGFQSGRCNNNLSRPMLSRYVIMHTRAFT